VYNGAEGKNGCDYRQILQIGISITKKILHFGNFFDINLKIYIYGVIMNYDYNYFRMEEIEYV